MGDGQQRVGDPSAPQGAQPLQRPGRRRHIDEGTVVARERERDIGTRQGEDGERFHDGAGLGRLSAQELPARGCIEEQGAHRHAGPALPHGVLDRLALSPHYADPRAAAAVRRRLQLEARHRSDRRERLTSEAERRHADQVRRIADLAGGVARQRERRVLAPHPLAVVAHPDERLPPVLDRDANRSGAGIERVLDELLYDRGRPLDHLAGGDLVRDLRREHRNPCRHSGTTSDASSQPRTPSGRPTWIQAPWRRSI